MPFEAFEVPFGEFKWSVNTTEPRREIFPDCYIKVRGRVFSPERRDAGGGGANPPPPASRARGSGAKRDPRARGAERARGRSRAAGKSKSAGSTPPPPRPAPPRPPPPDIY
jgi:hypothetical protein